MAGEEVVFSIEVGGAVIMLNFLDKTLIEIGKA